MENRFVLIVVLFFVIGSAMVSSINSLSQTFKTTFNGIALIVLMVLGLVESYRYFTKNKQ